MRQHQQHPPPPLPPTVPAAAGRLVLRLLSKDPMERPQDARAVVEALDLAFMRITPELDRLQDAAYKADQRRSAEDAARAAQSSKQVAEQNRMTQALADLVTF